ncbi:MAG: TonB-dependent receptor, partial [Bacteroidota bacterium]
MKLYTLKTLFCISLLLVVKMVRPQNAAIEVSGTVISATNGQALEFATVMLVNPITEKAMAGTTTDKNGVFRLTSPTKDFHVKVSFIGFEAQTLKDLQIEGKTLDVGEISLAENVANLDEVEIRAEKSRTEFKLDKRVFNVGKDLSSSGASALEVLDNVPSVNVNIEGEISLRGSQGVQILINGKPSVLASEGGNALGTITADMIDKIEVITNPSAKYEAEGTSGIINIVIKKEERKGVNGSVSLNTGSPHNHSFGLSLNRRTEKFNLFSQLGAGYRELPNDTDNINRDLRNNTAIISDGREYRNETFYNLILGTDYLIDKNNIITLSGSFALEMEDQPSQTNFSFEDSTGLISSEWFRTEETEAVNPKFQYELQYKRNFTDHKDHVLLFSALGNSFVKDLSSTFSNQNTLGDFTNNNQRTQSDFKEARYTFKLDYTKPFTDEWTLETGAQYVIMDVGNEYALEDLIDNEWIENEALTNDFDYDQKVLGIYGTGAYENDRWGVKAGLRVENTDLRILLVNTDESNRQLFTNLFPSLHTSYKFSEFISLQAGYSRRISRPRMWDLNPFFNPRNNFSIRAGNPNLLPEFTDSYELTSIYLFNKASLNFGVYHRFTTDVVERVATFEDNVTISMPMNIGTNQATGIELNGKYTPAKWFTLNGDFNFQYFNRKGTFQNTSFDFNADQWSTQLTGKFALPADIDVEIS